MSTAQDRLLLLSCTAVLFLVGPYCNVRNGNELDGHAWHVDELKHGRSYICHVDGRRVVDDVGQ